MFQGMIPEHSNLVYDMVPIPWSFELLYEQPMELLSYFNQTSGHGPDVSLPFLVQGSIVQNKVHLPSFH